MAIVKMNRFLLLTFERHKQPLLKALQAAERTQFKRLSAEDFAEYGNIKRNAENAAVYENDLARVTYAADRLKQYADLPTGLKAMTAKPAEMTFEELDGFTSTYDYASVCTTVQTCDERLKAIQTEITKLKTENENLKSWANIDVAPAELDRLKSVRYAIGAVNKNAAQGFTVHIEAAYPNAYVETLRAVKDDTVFFISAPVSEWEALSQELKNTGFTRSALSFTGLPSEKIAENTALINTLTTEAETVRTTMISYAPHYSDLRTAADYFRTTLERAKACENFVNLADVLIIEGWSPEEDSAQLTRMLNEACQGDFYLEETPVPQDDLEVPIALKNNKVVSAFEDVTVMFSLPRYNEIDPTPLLAPFYWMFFGIMVGDAGYGLVILIGTTLALRFLNLKKGMRNFMKFFFYLSFATIGAGILFGSAFGFPFFTPLTAPDGSAKAILDSQLDITLMMILSVAVGVVHVFFGLGIKGYMAIRDGRPLDALFDSVFWIVTLLSGILLLVSATGVLPASLSSPLMYIFFGGLIALAATSGRSAETVVGKVASGLYNVYGISGYVGDLVSYTRLVALSLSGAYIAYSFNLMAGLIPFLPLKILFGGAILLFGQSLNMGLSLLGAYVHSCRLQFVEFFGKFYEGGGLPFKPLAPKNVFVTLTNKDTN